MSSALGRADDEEPQEATEPGGFVRIDDERREAWAADRRAQTL